MAYVFPFGAGQWFRAPLSGGGEYYARFDGALIHIWHPRYGWVDAAPWTLPESHWNPVDDTPVGMEPKYIAYRLGVSCA